MHGDEGKKKEKTNKIDFLVFFCGATPILYVQLTVFASCVVQYVSNYPNPDYPNSRLSERLDVTMFLAAAEKRFSGHWSSVTTRRKQSCCMNDFSQMLQCLFQPVRDVDNDLWHLG